MGFYAHRSYTPHYTASVSFTVQTTNPLYSNQQYYNASTAEQMAKTFPYILTSGALLQQVQQKLEISSMPSLSAQVLGSTNIFTLSSTATDPQLAYDVLKCVVEIYPNVAEFVVGPTSMTLIDDSGVPAYPINAQDLRRPVVLGVAAGIALWLMMCLFYWLTHRTVNTEQELQKLVNLPYLGNIPQLPGFSGVKNKSKCPVLSSRSDKFGFSESIRLLRIRVERANLERKLLDFSLVGEDVDIFSTPARSVFAPKSSKKGKGQNKCKKSKRK
jgi:receptor protein-tyrosine kinase